MIGDDLIVVPYTTLKTEFAAKPLTMYYTETATPHSYAIYVVSTTYGLTSIIVSGSDITDFETNYKPSATSVVNGSEAIALKQFPEYLAVIGSPLNPTNEVIRISGGQGMGDAYPSPKANLPTVDTREADGVYLNKNGQLVTHANITGDQGTIRDDFNGSAITTALTGTLNFTSGSTTVTGSGTLFTTELNRDQYIKANAHAETTFTRVRRVISDTSLELEQGYLGATASAAASSKSRWPTVTGSGGSFAVGSSNLTIASGTTSGSRSYVSRPILAQCMHVVANSLNISQRIANQEALFGLMDNPASPGQQAVIVFDGTVNTTIKFRTSSSSSANDTEETSVTLPFGLTTALTTVDCRITLTPSSVQLVINGVIVATHDAHIPEPFTTLYITHLIRNTAVVTTTNFVVGTVYTTTFDKIQIANIARGEPVQVRLDEEIHNISGIITTTATTADQVIVSYTVPTNRTAYIIGYMVSANGNVDGTPVKVGKNTITTEPAGPGATDSNFFRIFRHDRSPSAPTREDFSASPRPFGMAGDVLKIAVTPSGTGSTQWRAVLEVALRRT